MEDHEKNPEEHSEKKEEINSERILNQKAENLKNKIKNFLNDKENLIFLGIFILAIAIRLYYFSLTKSQPLWWDESDYLAYAKNLAGFSVDWIVTVNHNSLFPYIAAVFLSLGFSEVSLKFLLEFLPSILLVYLTYKICILMYDDKRVALISGFLMAVFWNILFNSMRFHLEAPALLSAFAAIYIFWQGYEKREKIFGKINPDWTVPLAAFFIILTYALRRMYILFGLFFLFYMFFTKSFKDLIKDKYNWIGLGVAVIFFFIVEKFVFISKLSNLASSSYNTTVHLSLDSLHIFGSFFNSLSNTFISNIWTYLFWIGFAVISFNLVLSFGYFKKKNFDKNLKSDLFNFLSVILTLAFFIIVLKINFSQGANYEPRWFFPLLFSTFVFTSKGILFAADSLKKYHKLLPIILILLLLGIGGYYQVQHADQIIKAKIPSYQGIKEAGLFLKDISSPEDIIISKPVPQTAYYSERNVWYAQHLLNRTANKISFEEFLVGLKNYPRVKYIVISFSEPGHFEWMRNEKEEFARHPQTGQLMRVKWEIPFMNTTIDFVNNVQDIKQEMSYGDIQFRLLAVKQDAFIYEILHQ